MFNSGKYLVLTEREIKYLIKEGYAEKTDDGIYVTRGYAAGAKLVINEPLKVNTINFKNTLKRKFSPYINPFVDWIAKKLNKP